MKFFSKFLCFMALLLLAVPSLRADRYPLTGADENVLKSDSYFEDNNGNELWAHLHFIVPEGDPVSYDYSIVIKDETGAEKWSILNQRKDVNGAAMVDPNQPTTTLANGTYTVELSGAFNFADKDPQTFSTTATMVVKLPVILDINGAVASKLGTNARINYNVIARNAESEVTAVTVNLFEGDAAEGTPVQTTTVNPSGFDITGLTAETEYTYTLQAKVTFADGSEVVKAQTFKWTQEVYVEEPTWTYSITPTLQGADFTYTVSLGGYTAEDVESFRVALLKGGEPFDETSEFTSTNLSGTIQVTFDGDTFSPWLKAELKLKNGKVIQFDPWDKNIDLTKLKEEINREQPTWTYSVIPTSVGADFKYEVSLGKDYNAADVESFRVALLKGGEPFNENSEFTSTELNGTIHVTFDGDTFSPWLKAELILKDGTIVHFDPWDKNIELTKLKDTFDVTISDFKAIGKGFVCASETSGYFYFSFNLAGTDIEKIDHYTMRFSMPGNEDMGLCDVPLTDISGSAEEGFTGRVLAKDLPESANTQVWPKIKAVSKSGKTSIEAETTLWFNTTVKQVLTAVNTEEGDVHHAVRINPTAESSHIEFHNPFSAESYGAEYVFKLPYLTTWHEGHSGDYISTYMPKVENEEHIWNTENAWAEDVHFTINNDKDGYIFGTLTFTNNSYPKAGPAPTTGAILIDNISYPLSFNADNTAEFQTTIPYSKDRVVTFSFGFERYAGEMASQSGNIHTRSYQYTVQNNDNVKTVDVASAVATIFGFAQEDVRDHIHRAFTYSDTEQLNGSEIEGVDWKSTARPTDWVEDKFWNPSFTAYFANKIVKDANEEQVDEIYVAVEFENGALIPLGFVPNFSLYSIDEDNETEWIGLFGLQDLTHFENVPYETNIYVGKAVQKAKAETAASTKAVDPTQKFVDGKYGIEMDFHYSQLITATGNSQTRLMPYQLIAEPTEDQQHTTGVEEVAAAPEAPAMVNVFNLQGICVKANVAADAALAGLPQGIYIVNGRKYIVR